MHKQVKSNRARAVVLVLSVFALVVTFAVVVAVYVKSFSNALLEENSNYLAEIAEHIAVNIGIVVEDRQVAMETAGLTLTSLKADDTNLPHLKRIRDNYGFEYVGFVGKDGMMRATMPSEQKDVSGEGYFKRTFAGESVVEYVPIKIFQDRVVSGMLFSVPVYYTDTDDKEPVGILVALLDMKKFAETLHIAGFNGSGSTYILDGAGEIVLYTRSVAYGNLYNALANTKFAKGYSVDKVMADLSAQKSGFAVYSDFGVEKYMYYKSVGVDSWSVVSVIEKNIITANTTRLARQLTVIGIAVIILFPILLVFALLSLGISKSYRQAADSKTAFLANMSHEIRTPMNAIVGIGEILLREDITAKQKNYVLSMLSAGNGLLTIINDILDISKMESGKFAIVEEEYEFESLLYDLTTIVAVKIGDKPVSFIIDTDAALPKYMTGDMIRVKQVLLNIIGNAVKFTRSGHIKLSIRVSYDEEGKLELEMPVEDTGIGIEPKNMDKLFVSFNQVDTHKNHSIEGTGLGLVIARRLCEMMGGGITVESVYGKGSTFTVKVKQLAERPEKLISVEGIDKFNVLLLEPNDYMRDYYSGCMDGMGVRYDVTADYAEFTALLAAGAYTHALLGTAPYGKLVSEGKNGGKTKFVAVLNPSDQGRTENYGLTIVSPLFAIQLSAVLNNKQAGPQFTKHIGIDILSIQPMPFVNVLFVDDNEVNLQVVNGLVSPYHMRVDCVTSGKKAIAMIKAKSYDLVFMDHMMPEMDGVEAVKIIRLFDDDKRGVPIVALTANVTSDAKQMFLNNGFDDFLAKPIETLKLNMLLKKWLKKINDERAAQNPEEARLLEAEIAAGEKPGIMRGMENKFSSSEYVSFKEGAEKLGGSEVYCGILETYRRTALEKLSTLPALLDSDLGRFTIEIHGLKGASGGICADFIANAARELEALAKAEKVSEIRRELPGFIKALNVTIAEIDVFISENCCNKAAEKKSATAKAYWSGKVAAETLEELKAAFNDYDTEKLKEVFARINAFDYDAGEHEFIALLESCYVSYEFERPVQLIEEYENHGFFGK